MSKDARAEGTRAEIARVVSGRMGRLGISTAEVRRRSGLSVNTIRSITEGARRHNRSTLVAISAVLEWPWDYLVNILDGRADKNVGQSPLEAHLVRLAAGIAEIDALGAKVSGLTDVVHEVDRKISLVIESQHAAGPQ